MFLKEVYTPAKGSIITFDKGYVYFAQCESFSKSSIWYATRSKGTALYEARDKFNIPYDANSGVLKAEEVILSFADKKEREHRVRRIAYW